MNKYNNPRLLNTVVSGTGMKNPVRPHVIIGSEKNGFIRGDLMDANAVKEAVAEEVAERIDADLNLSEEIDTKVRQAVDDLVDGAPEVLDTLKELSEAIGDDGNFITTMTEQLSEKVDKVEGKDLSTNDYSNEDKAKLAGIAEGAEVNVQSDWLTANSSYDSFIKNKPTKLSQFQNDTAFVTADNVSDVKGKVEELYKDDINVADILYSDGTITPEVIGSKTPIGICVGSSSDFEDGKARFISLKYMSRDNREGTNTYSINNGNAIWFQDNNQFEDLPLQNYTTNTASDDKNGEINNSIILNSTNADHYIAVDVCKIFDPGYKQGDWYLPAVGELAVAYSNKITINRVIQRLNATITYGAQLEDNALVSSTESSSNYIFTYSPASTTPFVTMLKYSNTGFGKAVRAFLAITPQVSGKIADIEALLPEADIFNGHEYVDLGLPSGTLWATCNVGAHSPEEYGDYYMYGMGSKTYDAADTPYDGTENPLDLNRDTARQVMGGAWHTPTAAQMEELMVNTTYQWVTNYKGSGINGGLFTATNSAVLFLPATGFCIFTDDGPVDVDSDGYYWSSSPFNNHVGYSYYFNDGGSGVSRNGFEHGFSVRGVINPEDVNKTFVPVASKDEVQTNERVVAAALNDLNKRISAVDLEQIQTSISYVESYCDYIKNDIIDEHEFVIAEAITKLKTKLDEANIKLEDINSELEDIDAIRQRTIFTPAPVDPGETIQIFDGSSAIDELEDIVTNTNTRKFLTTVRGNKTLIVGFVDFFTDWAGHQITAVATSNIHLDEWDNESDLTLVPHTDGKANIYVAYCGLHDPAGYSGLVEGEWTSWKKFNTDVDDLRKKATEIIDRSNMPVSTFQAIFTDASVDDLKWIVNNYDPVFYIMSEGNTSYPVGNGQIFASNDFSMITVVVTTPYANIPNFSGSYVSPPVVASISATINGDNVSWNNWVALHGNLSNGLA